VAAALADARDAAAAAAKGGIPHLSRASDAGGAGGDAALDAAADFDLRTFARGLSVRGHRVWLRTGNALAASADPQGASDDPEEAPVTPPSAAASAAAAGGGSLLMDAAASAYDLGRGAIAPPAAAAPGSAPPSGSNALLAPPRHTFVVALAPAPAPAADPPAAASQPAPVAVEAAAGPGPGDGAEAGRLLVVDPAFKEQFSAASVASAAPGYLSLVAALPEVVVGGAAGLAPLVEFMCEQVGLDGVGWELGLHGAGLDGALGWELRRWWFGWELRRWWVWGLTGCVFTEKGPGVLVLLLDALHPSTYEAPVCAALAPLPLPPPTLQMERAFILSGTPLPPWREASHLLSCWLPASARDVPVPAETATLSPIAAGGGGALGERASLGANRARLSPVDALLADAAAAEAANAAAAAVAPAPAPAGAGGRGSAAMAVPARSPAGRDSGLPLILTPVDALLASSMAAAAAPLPALPVSALGATGGGSGGTNSLRAPIGLLAGSPRGLPSALSVP
jgi:hypothetical protein